MSFAPALLDNFNRGDQSPTIDGWADIENGLAISGNRAVGTNAAGTSVSYWGDLTGRDCQVAVTLADWSSSDAETFGLIARVHNISGTTWQGYLVEIQQIDPGFVTADIVLYRVDGGSVEELDLLEGQPFVEGDSIGLECVGSIIRVYHDTGSGWGSPILEATDSTYLTSGFVGLYVTDIVVFLDDFRGSDAATPSSQTATFRGCHQSLMLPVLVSDPLWWTDRRGYITTLFREVGGLSFSTTDTIGFDRATLPLKLPRVEADDWLLDGLGRHIVIKNESGVIIWEGFVNLIRYRYGGSSRSIGPLIEMANVVDGVYSSQDTSTSPPTNGARTEVGLTSDTDSIERYGEVWQTLSLGTTTDTLAARAVAKFLNEKKFPPRSTGESFPGGSDMELTLECLGYGHLFGVYTYTDEASEGEGDLSILLWDIISAYPLFDTVFSADTSRFTENTLQVPLFQDGSPRAKALIEELLSYGDASDNKYVFGVYAGRQIVYEQAPTAVEYVRRVNDRKQEVEDRAGGRIWPWNVTPGKWLRTPDLLPGRSQPADLREDIRNTYIVSVSFTAPDRLEVSGDEMEELPQMLAKIQRGVNL